MGSYMQPTPHPLSRRPIYTEDELSAYLSALQHQPPLTLSSIRSQIKQSPLSTLTQLQRLTAHLAPWGSLTLHYTPHHPSPLTLDPSTLFTKIVTRRHGGYCMENNTFFSTILHSLSAASDSALGYTHYTTGARISYALEGTYPSGSPESDGFMGWGHQVLIVDIPEGGEEGSRTKYLVDIGLGAQGSLEPIELREGAIAKGAPGVTLRLVRRSLADFMSGQELWVLEFKTWKRSEEEPVDAQMGVKEGWKAAYAFEDREWLPQDFVPLSFSQSVNPRSMFVKTLVLTRVVLSGDGGEAIGQVTLVGKEFSRRLKVEDGEGGWMVEKEVLRVCETEEERVEGLERWFGVVLRMDERRGIKGLPSALGERGLEFDRGR